MNFICVFLYWISNWTRLISDCCPSHEHERSGCLWWESNLKTNWLVSKWSLVVHTSPSDTVYTLDHLIRKKAQSSRIKYIYTKTSVSVNNVSLVLNKSLHCLRVLFLLLVPVEFLVSVTEQMEVHYGIFDWEDSSSCFCGSRLFHREPAGTGVGFSVKLPETRRCHIDLTRTRKPAGERVLWSVRASSPSPEEGKTCGRVWLFISVMKWRWTRVNTDKKNRR